MSIDESDAWVSIVMGSTSDLDNLRPGIEILKEFEIPFEVRVISAHRSPEALAEYSRGLKDRGVRCVIAGAGWAAALAGVVAAHTPLPVMGVPMPNSPLQGLDSILATVQMPGGVPVATMALGTAGAKNAAIFAASVIGLSEPRVQERIETFKREQEEGVREKDRRVMEEFQQVSPRVSKR